MLKCFNDYKSYFSHFESYLGFIWFDPSTKSRWNWIWNNNIRCLSYTYVCWCSGDLRSWDISRHGIDPQNWNIRFVTPVCMSNGVSTSHSCIIVYDAIKTMYIQVLFQVVYFYKSSISYIHMHIHLMLFRLCKRAITSVEFTHCGLVTSTLVQVMACCLMATSHYLNQCWLIISEVLQHSHASNFTSA